MADSYRLMAKHHTDSDGRKYEQGDTVKSDKPLDKMFVNIFQKLSTKKGKNGKSDEDEDAIPHKAEHGGKRRDIKKVKPHELDDEGDEDGDHDTSENVDEVSIAADPIDKVVRAKKRKVVKEGVKVPKDEDEDEDEEDTEEEDTEEDEDEDAEESESKDESDDEAEDEESEKDKTDIKKAKAKAKAKKLMKAKKKSK